MRVGFPREEGSILIFFIKLITNNLRKYNKTSDNLNLYPILHFRGNSASYFVSLIVCTVLLICHVRLHLLSVDLHRRNLLGDSNTPLTLTITSPALDA
jgi:hypothetical protein